MGRQKLHFWQNYKSGSMNIVRDCRYGKMIFNPNDLYIGHSLDFYGEFSEKEVEIFRLFIKPGDIVIDAGANIGCHTVAFARLVGLEGAVISFEPERSVFQTLCGNLAINSLYNVSPLHAALGDKTGAIEVPYLDYEGCKSIGQLSLEAEKMPNTPYYNVPIYTIDSMNLDKCGFIKIDVEGMELKVLIGANDTINRLQPVIYVENDRVENSLKLKQHMIALGYAVYQHLPALYNEHNYYNASNNIFGGTASCNLLCLPHNAPLPFSDEGIRIFPADPDNYITLGNGLKL